MNSIVEGLESLARARTALVGLREERGRDRRAVIVHPLAGEGRAREEGSGEGARENGLRAPSRDSGLMTTAPDRARGALGKQPPRTSRSQPPRVPWRVLATDVLS